MDISEKIRAGRAVLDWSREELAERSGVSISALTVLEGGSANPKEGTIRKITRALSAAGLVLAEDGVSKPDDSFVPVSGADLFLDVLDDVYYTLLDMKKPELLIEYSDDALSPPEVVGRYRKIRNIGIRMRQLVCEGNTYLMGAVSEYKWLPSQYFKNYLRLTYGDKVFLDFGESGLLIRSSASAEAARNDFNFKWDMLPELDVESTANVRF